jgi:uncharacterized membrane protein AbrB (regulator of aidB expression)
MKLYDYLENRWWSWALLVVLVIGVVTTITAGSIRYFPAGIVFFPLGLVLAFNVDGITEFLTTQPMSFIYTISYYALVGFLIYKVTKDKKRNLALALLIVIMLLLTSYGCVRSGL